MEPTRLSVSAIMARRAAHLNVRHHPELILKSIFRVENAACGRSPRHADANFLCPSPTACATTAQTPTAARSTATAAKIAKKLPNSARNQEFCARRLVHREQARYGHDSVKTPSGTFSSPN
jgi:hypothetical protein